MVDTIYRIAMSQTPHEKPARFAFDNSKVGVALCLMAGGLAALALTRKWRNVVTWESATNTRLYELEKYAESTHRYATWQAQRITRLEEWIDLHTNPRK
jgi:hypothetical protein